MRYGALFRMVVVLGEGSWWSKGLNWWKTIDFRLIYDPKLKFCTALLQVSYSVSIFDMFSADSLGLTASEEYDMAVRALGAITWWEYHFSFVFNYLGYVNVYFFAIFMKSSDVQHH